MNEVSILERIVEEGGNCCWARPHICRLCPLSKLQVDLNGRYMSCVEAVGIDGLTEAQADVKYRDAALEKLAEFAVDKLIEGDDS